MGRFAQAVLWFAVLFVCVGVEAQASTDFIITVRRTGVIEFLDPATLKTISSITVNIPPSNRTGLNGVFANPDGRTIYVEGPAGAGCCWLYSIDLATLQTKKVADIWGTRSRRTFLSIGPSLLQPISAIAAQATEKPEGDHWQSSPDGRWWFSLRSGPALDLYDVARGEIVRSFTTAGLDEPWWSSGAWLGNRFYVYATHGESGRLWTLSAESTQLGASVAVPELGSIPGCSDEALTKMAATGDRLLLYEIFGAKIDRRDRCDDVPGGAWMIEPATGQFTRLVASTLHFWQLFPSRSGSELYGITSEVPNRQAPAHLLRLDAHSGKVLQSRVLESDHWWMAFASLREIPSGPVSVALAADEGH